MSSTWRQLSDMARPALHGSCAPEYQQQCCAPEYHHCAPEYQQAGDDNNCRYDRSPILLIRGEGNLQLSCLRTSSQATIMNSPEIKNFQIRREGVTFPWPLSYASTLTFHDRNCVGSLGISHGQKLQVNVRQSLRHPLASFTTTRVSR